MNRATPQEWLWRGLHLAITLALPLLVLSLTSCIKAKEEKADLGPEVAASQIDAALSKAVGDLRPTGVHVGQYLYYGVSRRLENEESALTLGSTRVEVFNRTETDTEEKFSLKITKTQRLNDGSFEVRQSEEPLILLKSTSVLANEVRALDKKPIKITYHRLRETNAHVEVPKAVKNRPDCGGLSPCELPVRYLQFDMVQWFSDETYQKVSFDFAFSAQTPRLPFGDYFDRLTGALITDCRATVVPVEGRTVYVRDCFSLEDFQK